MGQVTLYFPFSDGGFPDTSRTLYQYGSPAFIRPLPLQKLIIYFPFEYHISAQLSIWDKDKRVCTYLKMVSLKKYTNLKIIVW